MTERESSENQPQEEKRIPVQFRMYKEDLEKLNLLALKRGANRTQTLREAIATDFLLKNFLNKGRIFHEQTKLNEHGEEEVVSRTEFNPYVVTVDEILGEAAHKLAVAVKMRLVQSDLEKIRLLCIRDNVEFTTAVSHAIQTEYSVQDAMNSGRLVYEGLRTDEQGKESFVKFKFVERKTTINDILGTSSLQDK